MMMKTTTTTMTMTLSFQRPPPQLRISHYRAFAAAVAVALPPLPSPCNRTRCSRHKLGMNLQGSLARAYGHEETEFLLDGVAAQHPCVLLLLFRVQRVHAVHVRVEGRERALVDGPTTRQAPMRLRRPDAPT